MREVVGDRQRFGALEEQRVVERHRRRLEQQAHRAQHGRREARFALRRLAIERDERAHAPAATTQGKRHHGADGRVADARIARQIGGDEFLAAVHHPARDRVHRRAHVRRQAAIGEHRQLSREIGADNGPARRRHPRRRTFDDELRDLRRFECGVDGADDVDERVAAFDAAAERALKHTQPCREIEIRRRQRNFARATELGSAFSGRTGGLVERD